MAILCATSVCIDTAVADTAFATSSRWMTGDWDGVRQAWLDRGIDIKLGYTGETGTLINGGYRTDHPTRYTDQFSIGADIDLHKLYGWEDTAFSLLITNRNGDTLDDDLNDPRASGMGSVQEIHGRGSATRLSELWMSKGWFDDALNIKLGRMAAADDFATEDCRFQNVAFCGSQPGNYVNTIYNGPISSWGTRVQYRLMVGVFAQIGAYNINPSTLENGNGFKLNTEGTSGTLFPVEAIWRPSPDNLPGEYRLGYFTSTAAVADLYENDSGQAAALTGNDYRNHGRRHGSWIIGKQQLTRVGGDSQRGLSLTASATFQDHATTAVGSYQKISLNYVGPFNARPRDELGFGIARMDVSNGVRRNAEAANETSGLSFDDAGYAPVQHSQAQAELHYRIQATGWLSLMPNLQYVKDPAGEREVANAWVLGLQAQSQF
jgi:porin